MYCLLLFRLLPLSFIPNVYRTLHFTRGLHWQWEKKNPKSNEHTPPCTSDLTNTESRYLLSELYMERQLWSSASGQFNRGVEVSVWGSCWNCRSKMQEASREHPKIPELLNVKCTKNDLEWKIRHLNQITHIFLKNVKGINLSRSFFLWSSLELSCFNFWQGNVRQRKVKHIKLAYSPEASAPGHPPLSLPFNQRWDSPSVTPQLLNVCWRWMCKSSVSLSPMVLLAVSPADQCKADS